MKLGIIIERLEAWRGGAETSTLELARLLREKGHEIHVVTSTISQSTPGLTIHQVPAPTVFGPLRTATFVRHAARQAEQIGFDVVLAMSPCPGADVYQPRGGLVRETLARNIATRSSAPRRFAKRAMLALNIKQRSLLDLERKTLREGGPIVVAVSKYVARQCEELYGLAPPRIRVVFNGVTIERPPAAQWAADRAAIRKQYHVPDSAQLLLFVAHNFRLKGLEPLIETASRLVTGGFTDFRVLVVGRDNPVRFQRRIHAQHLDRFVTFTGPTQRSTAFFCAADALVHPTYYDPCSRVVLEALALGVPVLTTRFNGASEVMTDGVEGFVIATPDEVGLWARRITELADPALREKMSAAALWLRDHVSMKRHVEELNAILLEAADRRGSMRRTIDA